MTEDEIGRDVKTLALGAERLNRQLHAKMAGSPHRNTFFISRDEIEDLQFQLTANQILLEKLEVYRSTTERTLAQLSSPWDYLRPASSL